MIEIGKPIIEVGRRIRESVRGFSAEFRDIVFELNAAQESGTWELQNVIRNAGAPMVPMDERFVTRKHPSFYRSDTYHEEVTRKAHEITLRAGIVRR
jgi:hypothetical protein